MKSLIIALLLIPSLSYAGEWTKTDTTLQLAYTALHVMDMSQTLYGRDNPNQFEEKNPILGKQPSRNTVYTYFIGTAIAHAIISYGLSKTNWTLFNIPAVTLWQSLSIGVEANTVSNNFILGSKLTF